MEKSRLFYIMQTIGERIYEEIQASKSKNQPDNNKNYSKWHNILCQNLLFLQQNMLKELGVNQDTTLIDAILNLTEEKEKNLEALCNNTLLIKVLGEKALERAPMLGRILDCKITPFAGTVNFEGKEIDALKNSNQIKQEYISNKIFLTSILDKEQEQNPQIGDKNQNGDTQPGETIESILNALISTSPIFQLKLDDKELMNYDLSDIYNYFVGISNGDMNIYTPRTDAEILKITKKEDADCFTYFTKVEPRAVEEFKSMKEVLDTWYSQF